LNIQESIGPKKMSKRKEHPDDDDFFNAWDDFAIVLNRVKGNGTLLRFASNRLKAHPEIVLAAVKQNGMALQYAPDSICDNEEIARIAMINTSRAYSHIGSRLKNNREIAKTAVESNWMNITAVPELLRNDFDFMIFACSVSAVALSYVGNVLKLNTKFWVKCLQEDCLNFYCFPNHVQTNEDFIREAIVIEPILLNYYQHKRDDENLITHCVSQKGGILKFASERLRSNKAIVMIALKSERKQISSPNKENVYSYATTDIQKDKEIFLFAHRMPDLTQRKFSVYCDIDIITVKTLHQ
jgi:hypothetical protein